MKYTIQDFTEKEQEAFSEAFYDVCDLDLDDKDCPYPWGCPWLFTKGTIEANSIEECAKIFFEDNKYEIDSLIQQRTQHEIIKKLLKEHMNNLQLVASSISGYEPNEPFSSARDDFYYDNCTTLPEKISHLQSYALCALKGRSITLSKEECLHIILFLDREFPNENNRYHAFNELTI